MGVPARLHGTSLAAHEYERGCGEDGSVKLALVGTVLLLLGAAAAVFGILPPGEVLAIAERVWPILLFVIAVTVAAELAAAAGVFDIAASWLARAARGRRWLLWIAVLALSTLSTAFLSLDTTAVLLTPVVVLMARSQGLPPLPFAFATVWLANTASLALPVSNLTNLLAVHELQLSGPLEFISLLGPSALVAIAVTVVLLTVVFRRDLRGGYVIAPAPRVADPLLLRIAAVLIVILLPLLISGLDPWIPATAVAVVLAVVFAWRSPSTLRLTLIPWQLVVFASGLFLAVGALEALGSGAIVSVVAGTGDDLVSLWQLAGTSMLAANGIDNLPAYLAFESVADSPTRLAALLVGVNAGSLITPWASLATLLWHQRLHAVGVDVPWRRYVLLGLIAAPLIVALAVIPLARW